MEQELLIQANEVARMLSISPTTVRIWTHKGYLPVVKVRRAARYRLSDVRRIQQEGLPESRGR
jgi:excisionase family DNA binding protein